MDADELRADQQTRWKLAAAGWARRASELRETSMPLSEWMVDQLALAPGQTVLELAAGPGDTGFLAASRIAPGKLISSDMTEAMLELARSRAREQRIENVEFKQLSLEWIDLSAASVDAILCRWGVMLVLDPAAAASEMRRVLRPGGRLAVAVWDAPERNPWATIPGRALIELGLAEPPDPNSPGMFSLDSHDKLRGLLESAGFLDVLVHEVDLDRSYSGADEFLSETLDFSRMFADSWERMSTEERSAASEKIAAEVAKFQRQDGSFTLPGRSLAASASA